MAIRDKLATVIVRTGIRTAESLGCERTVILNEHSIDIRAEVPGGRDDRAWDPDHYRRGNIFWDGRANPIKVHNDKSPHAIDADNPYVSEGDGDEEDGADYGAVSSNRFLSMMENHAMQQVLNPMEELNKIWYGVLAAVGVGGASLLVQLIQVFG